MEKALGATWGAGCGTRCPPTGLRRVLVGGSLRRGHLWLPPASQGSGTSDGKHVGRRYNDLPQVTEPHLCQVG